MSRILPDDVVDAYKATGAIPIRLAWTTEDARGGCAIDTLARYLNVTTDELRRTLDPDYESGFLFAWDSESPTAPEVIAEIKGDVSDATRRGFCDGLLCRKAVENTFSSELFPVPTDNENPS